MKKLIVISIFLGVLMATSVLACVCPDGCCADQDKVWANSVVSTTGTVNNPDKAVGAHDDDWAEVLTGASLTLDMGEGEEICDRTGIDIKVYGDSTDERAEVWVSNSPDSGFELAGTITSDEVASVYIGSTSYDKARYVKIVNVNAHNVEVDAVKAICVNCVPIPEFTTVGAVIAFIGAGAFALKKRKK